MLFKILGRARANFGRISNAKPLQSQGLSQDFKKMSVQNSNLKISAHSDLATLQLHIPFPNTLDSLLGQKRQFTLQLCLSQNQNFFIEFFACLKRCFSGKCPSKRQAGPILA